MRGRGFLTSLYGQVLLATVAGVLLGHFVPETGASLKPLGDGFIKLVRMIAGPVIFCTVVGGIAGMGDVKAVGRTGLLTILYFEIVTTLALLIGLVVVNVAQPGVGMNVNLASLDARAAAQYTSGTASSRSVSEFLL